MPDRSNLASLKFLFSCVYYFYFFSVRSSVYCTAIQSNTNANTITQWNLQSNTVRVYHQTRKLDAAVDSIFQEGRCMARELTP